MENLNVIKDLYELHETVKIQGKDITTKDYVKILNYKVDKDFLEEVTVSYIMEVYKYVEGEEALSIERVFTPPFPDGLKGIINAHRTIERKTPLQIITKPQ